MDWIKGMNQVIEYIEINLTSQIQYESLAHIVGCSVYEFSRIFSFVAGISISEYIRRRRLSQAVFDIQHSNEKIIDIALKYCYESPTTFSRAFKELHGATPSFARKTGVPLKVYPPIIFTLTLKGINAIDFRIEKKESFQIIGLSGYEYSECEPDDNLTPLWREFMNYYNACLWNDGGVDNYYTAPFWQVGAYYFQSDGGKTKTIIGAEYKGKKIEGMTLETIPAATWTVFSFTSPTGIDYVPAAYTRILTEWFPASQYIRDEAIPSLEVFPEGDASSSEYIWEIWMPVKNK
ncbi:MAG: AraC family transcriptional regulator [Lachnospiraceae bacterium]|nr:AraC family transcriptional regulator [Lachnospiraceae bacterium]